ncbi:polymorphic toxin-type HINT domain-containing protein [Streptomyces sp. NPDC059894]|uniref:polymorphic toxin-type HINT domain-containing protein n=1 Tax=unclassified Streptomyces TaxID=2593676 RepID=UPI00365A752E
MWLSSIQRTGKAGSSVALPAVTFEGVQKPNRVDELYDSLAPFIRLRMSQVHTETGGTIGVDYYDPDCTASTLPAADATNTTRCYPVKWPFEGEDAQLDWFNIYPVQRVIEGDNLVTSPDAVTEYTYLGGAKWAKSDDEFTKAEDRTYSVSRGYERVQTRKGTAADARTLTETRYFRGIDGAEVKDSAGVAVTDREQFAGMVRESATYNGDGGALVSATSYTPWRSAATASRDRSEADLSALTAYHTGIAAEETRTTVTGGTRTTKTSRGFDTYGMVIQVSEHGDVAKTGDATTVGDEKCTTTTYLRNAEAWLLNSIARAETVAGLCNATTITRPDDVIDDVRTSYDGAAFGVAPTKGLVTRTERINGTGTGYETTSSTPSICGTAKNELCYDQYGRVLATADAYGEVTRTTYNPTTGENPTSQTVTNALDHAATTKLDPLRGLPVEAKDANGLITSTAYDGLGRTTAVWLPTRSAATFPNAPNYSYAYQVRTDGPAVVTTKHLDHNSKYQTSYAFYDGLLRERQTQSVSPDLSGRLVTETFYNTRGEAWRTSGTFYTTGAPEAVLVTGQDTNYPSSTETVFDGAGRPTAVIAKKFGDETKRTVTTYTGDTTTVIPPEGGVAATTVVDALGRTVEVKQYTNADRTASQSMHYRYDERGRVDQITDASGAKWTYTYDVRGRQTDVVDPDTGKTHTTYDQGDRATDVTDARDITLHTDYDELGRRTAVTKGTTKLSAWSYDTVAKGQPTSVTRYIDGKPYVTETTEYNAFYNSTATKVTVPAGLGVPAGSYEWFSYYEENTGLLLDSEQPAIGDLPAEYVSSNYDGGGLLWTLYAENDPLISDATYDHYGRNTVLEYGEFGQHLTTTSVYDDHTGDLTDAYTDRDTAPQRIEDSHYTRDPAGNITQITTNYGQDAARTTDTQCFTLDALNRITEAWTDTGTTCATAPSSAVIGGQDPYWTSYTYDAAGNRETETQHTTVAGPAVDTVRTYTEPDEGKHNLPGLTQTGTAPHTESYTYNELGATETRVFTQGTTTTVDQKLDWDDEGHLKTVTENGKTTSYTYDADGQRLTRTDSTGTTLYLPGGNELHVDTAGKATGTRYYSTGTQTVAMRTGSTLTFLLADHHGTTTTQVTADATQAITRRKTGIFGTSRGNQTTPWAGDKGFVGGTKDTVTGLTHLGAREYDPAIGRFISVDPVLDLNDPQQVHGYTYSNNNPVTHSDPSGLCMADICGIGYPIGGTGANGGKKEYVTTAPKGAGGVGATSVTSVVSDTTTDSGGGDGGDDCGWLSFCGVTKAYNGTVDWVSEHKVEIAQVVTEVAVGVACASAATGAGFVSGGVGFAAAAGCGAIAGAAGAAVGNALTEDADHSLAGQLGDMAEGAVWGAAGGGVGFGAGNAASKLGKAAAKVLDKCHSFLPGTGVLLANGANKAIEDVAVGDVVVTTNPETGETVEKRVVDTITTEDDKDFTDISISVNGEYSSIVATDTHPFWVPDLKKWVKAGDLQLGQTLRTSAGTHVQITALSHYTKRQRTHDLTIEDIHAYYVLAGATPVLVHNCNLADYANSLRPGFNKVDGPFFAAKYKSPSGRTYFGHSGHDLTPTPGGEVDSLVRQFTPEGGRYHAGCAETMCLIQAEAAEGAAGVRGGSFEVVKVRGLNSPPGGAHGTPASPCPTVCQPRLRNQGISFDGN